LFGISGVGADAVGSAAGKRNVSEFVVGFAGGDVGLGVTRCGAKGNWVGEETKGTFGTVGPTVEGEGEFSEVLTAKKAPKAKAIADKTIAVIAIALNFLFLSSSRLISNLPNYF